jgi:hypothetical protein
MQVPLFVLYNLEFIFYILNVIETVNIINLFFLC